VPLPREKIDAYRNADYVVLGDEELVLRIGEPSPRLDALLDTLGAPCAAFVSAANPRGEPHAKAQNAVFSAALAKIIDTAGYPSYEGEGRSEDGAWVEPSYLIVGIFRENAEALGRLFSQNAIVFIERGEAPALIFLQQ
jgi:hypothetical protein